MKKILLYLFDHHSLDREQARQIMLQIGTGHYNEHEVTAFMTVFLMRTITLSEMQGFRDALKELSVSVDIGTNDTIDIVGTGGDNKNSFNISTLACFIVAGAGHVVVKHGNYGASSISGASNLMETLGYRFSADPAKLNTEIGRTGICFLHAPLFHPALKRVAGIRRNLSMRTFFNIMGPLVNPANPRYQMIGVYSLELLRIYHYLFQTGTQAYTLVHSLDGYDEISLTADTRVIDRLGERVCSPEQIGKRLVMPQDLVAGSSVEEAARIFQRILRGEGSWGQNAVVLANAAMAMFGAGKYDSYESAYEAAVGSLESAAANKVFQQLIEMQ